MPHKFTYLLLFKDENKIMKQAFNSLPAKYKRKNKYSDNITESERENDEIIRG